MPSNNQTYKILSKSALVDPHQLSELFQLAEKRKLSLYELLLDKDLISDEAFGKTAADYFGFPFVNLRKIAISDEILKIIPEIVAREQKVIAFDKDEKGLHFAMADPENLEIREFVKKKVGEEIIPYFITARDLGDALALYRQGLELEFSEIIKKTAAAVKGDKEAETPIIKIVDTIISYANSNKASDIHIEPTEDKSVVRFRIDGILHDVVTLPRELHLQMVTRIKVMARLRTDEHQSAQDGKLRWRPAALDIRVSIVPITAGEKVVMRLLSEKSRQFSLEGLGLETDDLSKVRQAIKNPYGMLLAVGPTGSGKTTSLYAILKILNEREVNITTIEDPVEYDMEGVNQIQVNPKTDLTFAAGLRSIVRQDPDIILVGEIRDEETADIAINSAMTGHLVLSTLHTNNAATTFVRLMDMKIEPFLVASTVNVVVAQRLVRKICTQCMESEEVKKALKQKNKKTKRDGLSKDKGLALDLQGLPTDLLTKYFGEKDVIRIYHGKGCDVCHHTGYSGRVGIFEVLEVNEKIKQAITKHADADVIQKLAVKSGMTTMLEDGLRKVQRGITTIEEVLRVTKE